MEPFGVRRRQCPPDDASLVVADEMEAVDAKAVGDAQNVGDEVIDGVLVHRGGPGVAA